MMDYLETGKIHLELRHEFRRGANPLARTMGQLRRTVPYSGMHSGFREEPLGTCKVLLPLRSDLSARKPVGRVRSILRFAKEEAPEVVHENEPQHHYDSDSGCHTPSDSQSLHSDSDTSYDHGSHDDKENMAPLCDPIDYFAPPRDMATFSNMNVCMRRRGVALPPLSLPEDLADSPSARSSPLTPCNSARFSLTPVVRSPHIRPASRMSLRTPVANERIGEDHIDYIAEGIVEFALTESPRCWERSFFR